MEKIVEITFLGNELKKWREEKGYSMHRLAELTDISASYINRLENGERTSPSLQIVRKIAVVLEIDVNRLYSNPLSEWENSSEISIEELLFTNKIQMNGEILNTEIKNLIYSIISKIYQAKWDKTTIISELNDIASQIDALKKLNLV